MITLQISDPTPLLKKNMANREVVNTVDVIWEAKNGTPLKTNMTLENPPFEDVFPIEKI